MRLNEKSSWRITSPEDALGREKGKVMPQIEAHLLAKQGVGACSCAVRTHCSILDDIGYKVQILHSTKGHVEAKIVVMPAFAMDCSGAHAACFTDVSLADTFQSAMILSANLISPAACPIPNAGRTGPTPWPDFQLCMHHIGSFRRLNLSCCCKMAVAGPDLLCVCSLAS